MKCLINFSRIEITLFAFLTVSAFKR